MPGKIAVAIAVLLASSVGAFCWGHNRAIKQAEALEYDRALSALATVITVRDAIEAGKTQEALPILFARIESDFVTVVSLHREHSSEATDRLRCAVSQRVRKFRAAGVVLSSDSVPTEALVATDQYLDSQCPGEPARLNWATLADGPK